jgi:hypothetical protein
MLGQVNAYPYLPVLKSNSIKAYDNMYQAEAASIQTKKWR